LPNTILIVDDNADARTMLTILLEDQGYMVICAENGRAALDLLNAQRPDLIITDLQMPELDGIELVKALRRESDLKDIPVLIMSAQQTEVLSEALEAGANAAFSKPVQLQFLIKLIENLLMPVILLSLHHLLHILR
jgi:CheY-like chemotaxis protein